MVRLPDGFDAAYTAYVEQGWNAIAAPVEYGGQGLPFTLGCNVLENLGAANMAFTLLPMLSVGAIEALEHHGIDGAEGDVPAQAGQRRMVGHDEPDRTSKRAAMSARCARPPSRSTDGEHAGKYRITGTEDLHHLGRARSGREHHPSRARARCPARPRASRGISLFVVPKYHVNADGIARPAQRSALRQPRTQARHQRLADLRDELRRQRRVHRRTGRRAKTAGSPRCSR